MGSGIQPIATATLDTPEAPKPKNAEDAAKQFEALLIGQMLRTAKEAEEDSADSTMLDVANQQFAKLLSDNGGLGLARMIVKGLR